MKKRNTPKELREEAERVKKIEARLKEERLSKHFSDGEEEKESYIRVAIVAVVALLFLAMVIAAGLVDYTRGSIMMGRLDDNLQTALDGAIRKALECRYNEEEIALEAERIFENTYQQGYMGAGPAEFDVEVYDLEGRIEIEAKTRMPNLFLSYLDQPYRTVKRKKTVWNYRDYGVQKLRIKPSLERKCYFDLRRRK